MTDLLVKLYDLPNVEPYLTKLRNEGIIVRKAMSYEKHLVIQWIKDNFSEGWASECDIAFSSRPISCFIATENGSVVSFACFDCTCRNFFGPMGVIEYARGRGIGKALLLACLHAMAASGFAYAIVGGVDVTDFYEKTVGAIPIPGSSPGIYRDRLVSPNKG